MPGGHVLCSRFLNAYPILMFLDVLETRVNGGYTASRVFLIRGLTKKL